jgi:hypothetical protein
MIKLLRLVIPGAWRPTLYLEALVLARSGRRVLAGPFQGMRYTGQAVGSAVTPKLLGNYECELAPVVDEIIQTSFDRLVDVGAGEGYYAVGLALRCPGLPVIAFEMDDEGRKILRQMAELNGVQDRLDLRGRCDPAELARSLGAPEGRHLLICDCEGYEEELLDPERVPALRRASILVELHEFVSRGISQRIRGRFEASHTVEEIWQQDRDGKDFPCHNLYTRLLPRKYLIAGTGERRPERMNWFWMKPKRTDGL